MAPSLAALSLVTLAAPAAAQGCNDVEGWVDSTGNDCYFYESNDMCGDVTNDDYENNGETADTACCECGGGESPAHADGCLDVDWVDSAGNGCNYYVNNGMCGSAANAGYANLNDIADTACCECGGGYYGDDVDDDCFDSDGWADSAGNGCDYYVSNGMCGAETNANYINFGHTADTGCCGCGGGSYDEDGGDEDGDYYSGGDEDGDEDGDYYSGGDGDDDEDCLDIDWVDSVGNGCSYYVSNGLCGNTANAAYLNFGDTADTACCECGGGDDADGGGGVGGGSFNTADVGVISGAPTLCNMGKAAQVPAALALVYTQMP